MHPQYFRDHQDLVCHLVRDDLENLDGRRRVHHLIHLVHLVHLVHQIYMVILVRHQIHLVFHLVVDALQNLDVVRHLVVDALQNLDELHQVHQVHLENQDDHQDVVVLLDELVVVFAKVAALMYQMDCFQQRVVADAALMYQMDCFHQVLMLIRV
jgi:hypothetical protein